MARFTALAVVPIMQKQKWGRVIIIASTTAPIRRPNYLHHITTKSAMIGMTKSIACELGDWNITVHVFMPGSCYGFVWEMPNLPQSKHSRQMGGSLFRSFLIFWTFLVSSNLLITPGLPPEFLL